MEGTNVSNSTFKVDFVRTLKVGFAFLGIMLFWEVYDYIMPLILSNYFGLTSAEYGIIMGLDNLLAIFLLPFFGGLSDKAVKAKYGRRTTFVFWGSIAAIISIIFLMIMELQQYNLIKDTTLIGIQKIIDTKGFDFDNITPEQTSQINAFVASLVDKGFVDASWMEKLWVGDVAKNIIDIQTEAARVIMHEHPANLVLFIVALLCILVSMASYRSPAIALMPDVTPKPVRSEANALITLMGGVGGALSIIVYKIFGAKKYESHLALWLVTAGLLLVILVLFIIFVKEKDFVARRMREEAEHNFVDEEEEEAKNGQKLPKEKFISLLMILGTVFLWFFGYNCVRSHMSIYCTKYLMMDQGTVGTINLVNGIGGAVALLPCAFLASKLGRKKTILVGLFIAALTYIPSFFMTRNTPGVSILFPTFFILSGFGMVFVNVNTLPMVTELSKGSDVGQYTGYYYVASMTAQAVTPYFAGLVMDKFGYKYLFVYAIIFVIFATITTILIKHGDTKGQKAENLVAIINMAGDD